MCIFFYSGHDGCCLENGKNKTIIFNSCEIICVETDRIVVAP